MQGRAGAVRPLAATGQMRGTKNRSNRALNCYHSTLFDLIRYSLFLFHELSMEFFKSAVASAISKGPPFPYTFGDRVDVDTSIWTLYNGTKRVCVYRVQEEDSC